MTLRIVNNSRWLKVQVWWWGFLAEEFRRYGLFGTWPHRLCAQRMYRPMALMLGYDKTGRKEGKL